MNELSSNNLISSINKEKLMQLFKLLWTFISDMMDAWDHRQVNPEEWVIDNRDKLAGHYKTN